ncbi:PLP-dependent aminotransferase family protein [uncultured Azohydromonas sp.]|jgi:Transcriptional regulators containing a DNA-binding HTH domain and an aminotransferase domain (MocR family) and their eukaryotic orthologs|uniref:aminotransferase-like domain-containing protein n=1 Tax=uncultured Azohydromonas sp. TaxID=487342 RepID=UPI002612FBA0|nr:PLP-dependent aminotransferase family protein [uncultured Azohydromonas sp.]
MKRYEQYADEIAELIRTQVLRSGDRLPSVRQASSSRKISPSTVFEAYYLLEARGLIQARPRSGYYVNALRSFGANEPATAQPAAQSSHVEISELVFQVLGSTRQPDVVPLGSAFPSPQLFPLEKLARSLSPAMRGLAPQRIVEELTEGSERLRRQIGLRYVVEGTGIDAGEIIITNGAMEALNLCLQAVTRPGDVVAVESPTFYAALQALERLQLKAVEVATHPRHGIELDSLAQVLQQHPVRACWFMPNFQNPLGSLMPEENKRALVELLARHEVPLIEDDVYGELYHGLRRPPPCKAFDRQGLVMHCNSFSKCLAPGYRVGWTAAGRFAQKVQRLKLMTSLATAVPTQEALSDYLQHGGYDRHLRQLRQTLADSQTRALRGIAKHFPKGTRVTRPEGGYLLWVELPEQVDALKLHRLASSQNISLAPGHLFSADRRFAHCLRLNYGQAGDARFDDAIRTIGQLASAQLTA